MTSRNPIENLGQSLGEYLREQRTSARLSLRQLADLAGVSNPYLSQIERGVKKPSAEILQQLAKGLQISSESLYVKAGFLDERTVSEHRPWDVETAVTADPALTERQKSTLIDIYRSFVGEAARPVESSSDPATPAAPPADAPAKAPAKAPKRPTTKAAATGATTRKKTPQKSSTRSGSTRKTSKTSTKKAAARTSTTNPATKAGASRTTPKTTTTKE
ncbi:helix-turn-helix domain-containing protein [Nostocoides sp. F2B08]|uniref:helix-turn-helix domain-containing protein n=1 Tax=Nostocoides sp. F2B08 TaxID=2653936 RepID=UPI001263AA96|nr:helix-turn-helix transcriptional regulator [Tetrasphaera sp. F2B08]KAB7745090.1 helix-turn-helix domain-containing protein [Tetrasphaera sp. F2B08]